MPRLEYFLVAESCSQDIARNSMSIFHVLSDVRVLDFPDNIDELCAISGWVMEQSEIEAKEELQLRIDFEMPDPDDNNSFRANLTSNTRFQHFYLRLVDVPIKKAGDIKVRLFLNDEEQATHIMQVSRSED